MQERMQERRRFRRIDVDLGGTIQFRRTNDTVKCAIRNISEEYMGVMIVTPDPRVCAREDLSLSMLIPGERSPVKCTGRIAWHSEGKKTFKDTTSYLAGIFITDISRIDRRRLDLFMTQKKAFTGSGYGLPHPT